MFLREALLRSGEIHRKTGALYEALCGAAGAAEPRVDAWKAAVAQEHRRARLVEALAHLCTALGDEGPFLIQIPVQVASLSRALESATWRCESCVEHHGCKCAGQVEAIQTGRLYADVLELAEPELRRALRAVNGEIRDLQRREAGAAFRPPRKPVAVSAA